MEHEFKTEQKISDIMRQYKFRAEDARRVFDLIDKLVILKKRFPKSYIERNKRTFEIGKEDYIKIMNEINAIFQSKGIPVVIFRDVQSYQTSSEDYDYYCTYKTPTQYRLDEEKRAQEGN